MSNVTLTAWFYCDWVRLWDILGSDKETNQSDTIPVNLTFFKPSSVFGKFSKSAVSWHSTRFPFLLSQKLSLPPPSLSARCPNVYLDHLLLTLLTEGSWLLCALWLIVGFTLASFYKGRIPSKRLRRRRRCKRSRFLRCSQLNSCCVTALNQSEICWRWKKGVRQE